MIEPRGQLPLAEKARAVTIPEGVAHDLERDPATGGQIASPIDLAHAAFAEGTFEAKPLSEQLRWIY